MNVSFKYYGKSPQTLIAKEALKAQAKYKLNDMQLASLLQIHDFFQRIIIFDVPIYKLRISEQNNKDKHMLPQGTRDFFAKVNRCSDLRQYICSHSAHEYFSKFADRVLTNIKKQSDYVVPGIITVVPDAHNGPTVFEYEG